MIRNFRLPAMSMLFSLLLISCSKDEFSKVKSELYGDWEWQETTGGIMGVLETPASTGKTMMLRFTSDQKYSLFSNGALTSEGTFSIRKERSIVDQTDKPVIVFSPSPWSDMMIMELSDNRLWLFENVYDGFNHVYVR
jgi:hypothetical protein